MALEAKIEAQFEAIKSRDGNRHVVPTHAGWFSWTKIHPLEEKMLPSFFSKKSEIRTPELYLEIRNWMMKKFHANPSKQIELKNLSEFTAGDEDSRLEVMEFLDYWGLINFHPLQQMDSAPVSTIADADREVEDGSLIESLYHFETQESLAPVVPRTSVATQAMSSGMLPDSSLSEELVKSEEPSVEYHCNSCSADCSRKRYHCQKQADFDLCTECFNNGKFGSDMSPSDFILMEPAEAGGASGGKWTDQETLLLLEALELYKENWNEIAEHVATKTKAQCILHFVEMPIEDTFLDCDDETSGSSGKNIVGVSLNNGTPAGADGLEREENNKQVTNEQPSSPTTEILKNKDVKLPNISEPEDFSKNFALEALKEAFEAVGAPSPGEQMSFANAGNPVMTVAAFLVRLVEPNIATAAVRNSLKSISVGSSGELLAIRHCFILEDPPDDKGQPTDSERVIDEASEDIILKDVNKIDTIQKEESVDCNKENKMEDDQKSNTEIPESNDQNNGVEKTQNVQEGKHSLIPANEIGEKLESEKISANECGEILDSRKNSDQVENHKETNELDSIDISKEQTSDKPKELDVSSSNVELLSPAKDSEDLTTLRHPAHSEGALKDETKIAASDKKESDHLNTKTTVIGEGKTGTEVAKDDENPLGCKNDQSVDKIKQAAITALSAAAVKAKVLARQEEEEIQQLAALLIEKQLYKLETKLSFFNEMENVVMRVREQLERSKQRLYHERAQIIASRLGISGSTPRPILQPSQINRAAMAFANLAPRSPFGGTSLRPPMSRPMMGSSSLLHGAVPGSSMQPSNQEKLPSVTNK